MMEFLDAILTDPTPPRGWVAFVGAGPGDPQSLNAEARNYLERANIVFFDDLVGKEILSLIPAGAARVALGDTAEDRASRAIAEAAGRGQRVVRLQGGDAVAFNRAAEESGLVRERGIDCVVVAWAPRELAWTAAW